MHRRLLLAWLVGLGTVAARAFGAQAPRAITVRARKYSYEPSRIEVQHNDLVKITLEATDIPHSFTVDAYRIAKRASPGHGVSFEFRADRPGTFPFYCNITEDEGCRNMRGELVVR
jgi:heme/copper-type cytochrome/quinol oxidase subunit 2